LNVEHVRERLAVEFGETFEEYDDFKAEPARRRKRLWMSWA
jgi:hypothetical protein